MRVDKDEVLVDIGYKSEGVIPTAELSIRRSVNPADEVAVGEEIDALVLTKEDAEGRLILSKKRARFELAWKRIEGAAESGEPVDGTVIEVVKGGLILDLGVRGFLPASLVDIRRVQDLDEFLGQELRCKVIELNRSRNNVVLSRRAVLEEERKDQRQRILDRLNPGDVVEGQISNIVDFGAFVDLDGMDGLIHISELSWSHVNHPSEVLEIGQTVNVKVLDIDRDRQRISLGLKQTQADPWQQVLEAYKEGDVVDGKVTKVVTFGAFVEILPGVEGLVHISELAQHHVENPREVVAQGQDVKVLILEVDAERRRLSLSMKRVDGDGRRDGDDDGQPAHAEPRSLRGGLRRGLGRAGRRRRRGSPPSRGRSSPRQSLAPRSPRAAEAEPAAAEARSRWPPRSRSRRRKTSRSSSPNCSPRPRRSRRRAGRRARARAGCRARRPTSRNRPLNVAITGGIGAGKSEALRAFARHGAATISSDEIVHELIEDDPEVKGALLERFGTTKRSGHRRRSSSPTATQLAWLEGLLHPRVVAHYLAWRERQTAPLAVTEVPLLYETGRRRPLRQGRRHHGAQGAARGAARAAAGRPRDAADRRQGEGEAGRLRVREHGLARGARRVRRVRRRRSESREDGCSWLVPSAVVAGVARVDPPRALAARRRAEAPLPAPLPARSSRGHARNYHLEPALLAAVIYVESKFRAEREVAVGSDRADAAAAVDRARHRAAHRRHAASRREDLYNPEINVRYGAWYLRHLLDKYGDERTALAAYNAGQDNVDRWLAAGSGIRFSETRAYVAPGREAEGDLPRRLGAQSSAQ